MTEEPTPDATIRRPGASAVATGVRFDAPPLTEAVELGPVIAQGGMGVIQRAVQRSLDRPIALKQSRVPGPESNAVLLHEARIASRLPHRSILPVHGLFKGPDGEPVLAMKLVEGPSWADRIAALPRPAERSALVAHVQTAIDVGAAMELAHSRGVLHLDLKPANIVEGEVNDVHVLDWGVALDRAHDAPRRPEFQGSPSYAAPEMVEGGELDERTDVYLLGACLYEALTGVPPHREHTVEASLEAARRPVPAPEGDEELVGIVIRALATDPEERWPDIGSLRAALEAWIAHSSSLVLVARARETLASLEELSPEEAPYQLDAAHGQLDAALDLWPENPEAQKLAANIDARAFDLHLALGDLDLAARVHAQLPVDDERGRRLQDALGAREASHVAAKELRGERLLNDPDLGSTRRLGVLLGAWLPIVVVSLFALWSVPTAAPSTADKQLRFILVVLGLWSVVVAGLRRWVPATRTNRSLIRSITAVLVGGTAHRIGCWMSDVQPVPLVMEDLLILSAGFMAFDLRRRSMLALGALCHAGAIAIAWEPSIARVVFLSILFVFPAVMVPSLLAEKPS